MMKFIPYGKQSLTDDDIQAVVDVLKSDFMTQGPRIPQFEEVLAASVGSSYAVAVNSGTAALHAAYFALGLKPGDEFITTPITFAATANAGLYLGARPVFADVEPDTGNIDVAQIDRLITPRTKMISVVHYAGHPVDLEPVKEICEKHNLFLVEDACHAIGAEYKGKPIGANNFADLSVFSFHPVKHIAMGEGGAVTTNKEELYQRLLRFRTHGITKDNLEFDNPGPWYYEMHDLGYNYRITEMQAALGITQLARLKENIRQRKQIAKRYQEALGNNPWFDIPVERNYASSAWHLFPIRLKEAYRNRKREIVEQLHQHKLGVQIHYIPVYMHPYYRRNGYSNTVCKNAEDFYRAEISIPMYHSLNKAEQEEVIQRIQKVFKTF